MRKYTLKILNLIYVNDITDRRYILYQFPSAKYFYLVAAIFSNLNDLRNYRFIHPKYISTSYIFLSKIVV